MTITNAAAQTPPAWRDLPLPATSFVVTSDGCLLAAW
jgi:hypothetical protein